MQNAPTFAERDRQEPARREKVAECTGRIERAFLREFDAAELHFIRTTGGPDLPMVRQALRNARTKQ